MLWIICDKEIISYLSENWMPLHHSETYSSIEKYESETSEGFLRSNDEHMASSPKVSHQMSKIKFRTALENRS